MLSPDLVKVIDETIERERPALTKLAHDIHANPELRFEEHKASAWIAELLRSRGVEVEHGLAGMSTALRAKKGVPGGGCIAILGEYDALPDIGHACGHNLIAASAVGAFLAAAAVAEQVKGEVVFLGTPAEEGGGGKIKMIDEGVFEGIDAAMMFHPFDRDLLAHPALASMWIQMTFRGAPAHAAAAPHDGKSALQACMDTFRLIDGQRVRFKDGVRVHGYITNGGQAVNIIPELASCEFSVRARDIVELERVRGIVERCAQAGALASDAQVDLVTRIGYRDMRNNMLLARAFGGHLDALGRPARESDDRVGAGSTDMGNVSHVVPSIHPYLAIVEENEALCHQHKFAHAAASERGLGTAMDAARALARTAVELLVDHGLRSAVKKEWEAGRI
ncbi:MAG: M20 family metallopeptidase [Labilithrix sp.]|nr:M20 family metallopeptidase [Labilithrix sp.]MCW5809859.1 M20 family metallopeptidase [Labilithrix sp.]